MEAIIHRGTIPQLIAFLTGASMRRGKLMLLSVLMSLPFVLHAQEQRSVLSAKIDGYHRDRVYFDCIQSPEIKGEFHTNPGEDYTLSFESSMPVSMLINDRFTVFLEPGDSLHVDMTYEGRKVVGADFSGSVIAVGNNNLYQDVERLKARMKYRTQLLGLVVLDVKPADRIDDSRKLLEKVDAMIQKAGDKISKSFATYLRSKIEASVYMSFMEYPVMYEETRKMPLDEQGIGNYWTIMDGIVLSDDLIALSTPEYVQMLMRYALFIKEKQAHEEGQTYPRPTNLEDMFDLFASSYDGVRRDYVLFTLMKNFIFGGKELERVDPLAEKYIAQYNVVPENKRLLEILLR